MRWEEQGQRGEKKQGDIKLNFGKDIHYCSDTMIAKVKDRGMGREEGEREFMNGDKQKYLSIL